MRTLEIGYMAIGLAAVAGLVPASCAQDPQGLDQGKPAGTGIDAKERQTRDKLPVGLRSEARKHMGVSVAVPIGRVWVDPELVGEHSYVRRTTDKGMTIVEVSTTPFMPVLASNGAELIARPDQPAGW